MKYAQLYTFSHLRAKSGNVSRQDVIVKYVIWNFFLLFILHRIECPGRQIQ